MRGDAFIDWVVVTMIFTVMVCLISGVIALAWLVVGPFALALLAVPAITFAFTVGQTGFRRFCAIWTATRGDQRKSFAVAKLPEGAEPRWGDAHWCAEGGFARPGLPTDCEHCNSAARKDRS